MAGEKKRKILKGALTVVAIIVVSLIFSKILDEWKAFKGIIGTIIKAASPILYGCVIAFLMNPILVFFDRLFHTIFQDKIIKDKKKLFKLSRTLSIIITVIFFCGIITGLLWLVIPQLSDSIRQLFGNLDTYYDNVLKSIETIYDKFEKFNVPEEKVKNVVETIFSRVEIWANEEVLPNLDKIVTNIGSGVMGGLKFIYNFLIGIVASIYIMANKEYLVSRCKKIIYAAFTVKKANLIMDGVEVVNKVFSQFINGKILDSFIIGLIVFTVTKIINMPYAILISVIVGVTNIIPFFGPIIGAIPCVIIVLIADPIMSVVLVIVILIIQQFDGNVLGPKILGDVTGLSSFWVLAAVIVGGGIFGFSGMLLGVPVFACAYMYINRICTIKLKEKDIVCNTSDFERLKRIDEETGEPIYMTEEEMDIRFKKKTQEEKDLIRKKRLEQKKRKHVLKRNASEDN
ncbi:MAG: AI-2E family transporter, partial [Coprococcus sp.]